MLCFSSKRLNLKLADLIVSIQKTHKQTAILHMVPNLGHYNKQKKLCFSMILSFCTIQSHSYFSTKTS
ncbi:hypothetical protein QVD17_11239 [Tagetes erecta]|uniref:Uncharacterized protein n=1 Tax=Tagetes erecta TaxID=13708 RepID=A0AAD8L0A3_TARER|nr:hypothetical protein QVD17_11239 [Tagetes erecta]